MDSTAAIHSLFSRPVPLAIGLIGLYIVAAIVYRLHFDQRSKIPGPKINAISRIPYIRHLLAGTTNEYITKLHQTYGDVVRLSPNQVSFISGETAWTDIYGFRTGSMKGKLNTQKDPAWYPRSVNGVDSLLIANDEDHARGRRLLSHAFSERALITQESLLQKYIDQLIGGLKQAADSDEAVVDMTRWYNWTTFDIIADLTFGEPFYCLQDRATHRYIALVFQTLKAMRILYVRHYWPWTKHLGPFLVDNSMVAKRKEFLAWVSSQVEKRLSREKDRPDFIGYIQKHSGEKDLEMTTDELKSNAYFLLIAGSETTATLLSGATYCLLTNPDKLAKLKAEVRTKWKDYSDITMAAVRDAPYLQACLTEALRCFPPVPVGFERRIGPGGEIVSGLFIPEGTAVSMSQYPANHSEKFFKHADRFVPERWMDDHGYVDDKRSVAQPFAVGPRGCLGKSLAYAEMRLILAKMVWWFDMELEERSRDWLERCKVVTLWEKPELAARVKRVER